VARRSKATSCLLTTLFTKQKAFLHGVKTLTAKTKATLSYGINSFKVKVLI